MSRPLQDRLDTKLHHLATAFLAVWEKEKKSEKEKTDPINMKNFKVELKEKRFKEDRIRTEIAKGKRKRIRIFVNVRVCRYSRTTSRKNVYIHIGKGSASQVATSHEHASILRISVGLSVIGLSVIDLTVIMIVQPAWTVAQCILFGLWSLQTLT